MNMGTEIKKAIKFRDELFEKIHNVFDDALEEAQSNELEVSNTSVFGSSLKATIHGYEIYIPMDIVIRKLKEPIGKIAKDIADVKIKSVVNELIIDSLGV